jgi:uncharacterized membrane protein YGL010W
MAPLLTATHHLGLYSAFHRASGNKALHALCVPVIFFTGAVFLAYAGDRSTYLLHAGTLLAWAVCGVLACIDGIGALALFAWLTPICALAGAAVRAVPSAWLLPVSALLHATAWALTVWVGHRRFEARLQRAGKVEDSNLYFRRGYFTARNIGQRVRFIDRLIQFNIAPLALTHDALVWLGLRERQELRIARERERVLQRLKRGEPPLASDAAS